MPFQARLLKRSNLKATLKTLSEHLDGFAKIALSSDNVRSLGLPPCNGWIVVRSLSDLKAVSDRLGWGFEGRTLTVTYPNYTERYHICEWQNLPRLDLVNTLTDYAVDLGFWTAEFRHPSGELTHDQIAEALDEGYPF